MEIVGCLMAIGSLVFITWFSWLKDKPGSSISNFQFNIIVIIALAVMLLGLYFKK